MSPEITNIQIDYVLELGKRIEEEKKEIVKVLKLKGEQIEKVNEFYSTIEWQLNKPEKTGSDLFNIKRVYEIGVITPDIFKQIVRI